MGKSKNFFLKISQSIIAAVIATENELVKANVASH